MERCRWGLDLLKPVNSNSLTELNVLHQTSYIRITSQDYNDKCCDNLTVDRIMCWPGKFLHPPAELPLTQRPSFTDTVQLCLSSPCNVSGVRLHISSLVKFFLKSSKDILDNNMKEDICRLNFVEKMRKMWMWWGFTHQNSLASTVCFFKLSLSAIEMVDHSFELCKDQVIHDTREEKML